MGQTMKPFGVEFAVSPASRWDVSQTRCWLYAIGGPAVMLGLTVILPAAWPMFAGEADQATLELGRAVALVTMIGFTVMSLVVAWRELLPLAVHGGGLRGPTGGPRAAAHRAPDADPVAGCPECRCRVERVGSGRLRGTRHQVLGDRLSVAKGDLAVVLDADLSVHLSVVDAATRSGDRHGTGGGQERFTTHGSTAVRASIAEHAVAAYAEPLAYGTKRHPGETRVAGLLLWSVFSVLLAFLAVNEGDVAAFLRVSVLGLATFAVAVAIWFKGEAWFGDD